MKNSFRSDSGLIGSAVQFHNFSISIESIGNIECRQIVINLCVEQQIPFNASTYDDFCMRFSSLAVHVCDGNKIYLSTFSLFIRLKQQQQIMEIEKELLYKQ
jgi:hypothetical protein